MAGNQIDVEPVYPLGDCGALLEYRLHRGQMIPLWPRQSFGVVGHSYVAVTCSVRGIPADVWEQLPVWTGPVASDKQVALAGLRHYTELAPPAQPIDWKRAGLTALFAIVAIAWILGVLLFTFGVIDAALNESVTLR